MILKHLTILFLVSITTLLNCNLIIYSDANGQNTMEMIASKKSLYSFNDRGKIKSQSILRRNTFYFLVNRAKDENYNWLFFMNRTDSLVVFNCEDGQPRIIQEAKNREGNWEPIEFWRNSTCGNSYGSCSINPGEYTYYKIHKYNGHFLTFLRVKINMGDKICYSPTFLGRINEEQFVKPERVKGGQINW